MASGRLGTSLLPLSSATTLYTVPAGKFAVVTVSALNTGTVAASISVAATSNTTADLKDYLEYNLPVAGGGVLERTGLSLSAGDKLVCTSTTANVFAITVHGIEQDL